MNYDNGTNILWDPVYIDAAVYEDDFTENKAPLYFY